VSVLQPGDRVLVHRQVGARHTGLKIAEERWYER
jgi:3-dehydroquinate synthase class II